MYNVYIYIIIMAVVTYATRALPLTLIRKKIKNRFIRSFLYYVPYVTLAVMTFPAILSVTENGWVGFIAMLGGIAAAYMELNLVYVALSCSTIVLILQTLIIFIK